MAFMGRIPDDKIEEVRAAADIAEVVGKRVKLIHAGRTLKALCPFHGDKDPSLVVNRERGTWHCFGCNEGGNVFTFVMRDEGLSFPEAVRELAQRYGVEMPKPEMTPAERREMENKNHLLRALTLAGKFFIEQLAASAGAGAREYLIKQRGLGPETLREFGLGFAPDGWEFLRRYLAAQGISDKPAMDAGVLAVSQKGRGAYDRFRNRVVFPIRDTGGRIVSFGGRILGSGEPKYLNGPESPVFRKSSTLYNLDKARPVMRRKQRALVVEGYFDVITLSAHGFGETVAPMGTALTSSQVRLLGKSAPSVVVVFDGDDAGLKAAERSLPVFLDANLPAKALLLPDGHDPDTFVRQEGPEAMERALDAARPLTEVVLDRVIGRGDISTPEGKSAAAAESGQVLASIKDPVVRLEYLRRTADVLAIPAELLARRLGLPASAAGARPVPVGTRPSRNISQTSQRTMLEQAMASASHARVLAQHHALDQVTDPALAPVARAIMKLLDQGKEPSADRVIGALEDQSAAAEVSRMAQRLPRCRPETAEQDVQALLKSITRQQKRKSSRSAIADQTISSSSTLGGEKD